MIAAKHDSVRRAARLVPVLALGLLILWQVTLPGQNGTARKLRLETGKEIYEAGCVACHGPNGKGMPDTTVGFQKPKTFPDFTACDQTTPELNVDWKATIIEGGHGRGFSPIMPSFRDALTPEQVDKVVGYLRTFCKAKNWPRGELNLPRPLITEKAFPEDEVVTSTSIQAQGAPAIDNDIIYEKRFGARGQIEVDVPVSFARQDTRTWFGGVGDVSLGYKRTLFASTGPYASIFSAQGGVVLPTGNKERGFGSGVTNFEVFGAYGQLLPASTFFQFQLGTEQPVQPDRQPRSMYVRSALGKSFRQESGIGRLWSPMVEFVGDRDFETGAKTNWDVVPEFQVTLSRRQHVRFNTGVRIPAVNTSGRSVQVVFYLLWDWFDGGILEGWR